MARYLVAVDDDIREDEKWPPKADRLWVDLGPQDQNDLKDTVKRLYPAHPAAVERVLNQHHRRPNLLVEDDALVFVLSQHATLQEHDEGEDLAIFLGKHFLVTVHFGGTNHAVDQAWRFVLQNRLLDQGVDFALYQVLTGHVEYLRRLWRTVDARYEDANRVMLKHPYRNLSAEILDMRRKTLHLKDVVQPELDIFELLKSGEFPYVQKRNRPYFEDLDAQMRDLVGNVTATRDALSEMVEAYTSMQSNEINKVMQFLTIISVLSLPATTIASIYGMNFYIPEIHWHYGYWYSLTVMLLVTALLLLYMKKRGWFGRSRRD